MQFSMSDSGLSALRSRLSIPVVGACQSALFLAAQLGKRFSIITMWQPWVHHGAENVTKSGLNSKLASIRHIDTRPDTHELLSGKEELVFEKLVAEANTAISQDGADVIVLGATTMHQSYSHLTVSLPCPAVSPGLAAYKACESIVDMGLSVSRLAYSAPERPNDQIFDGVKSVY